MKKHPVLIMLLLHSLAGFSQTIQQQLDALDTAYAKGEYATAKKLISSIRPGAITDTTKYVDFLSTCGSVYYQAGEYSEAGNYFTKAAERSREAWGESEYHYALAIFNLSACYKQQGRYAEAEPLLLKSLPVLAPAFGQSSIEYTRCFYTLVMVYIELGRYADAEGMCAAAVNFFKVTLGQDNDEYLGSMASMAIIYQGLEKYDKAEEILLALKQYYKTNKTRPDNLQVIQNNIGDLYRNMGDYERAEPALKEAIALAKENSDNAASSLNNLALVQKALGKYAEAEASYKKALTIYKSLNKTSHPDYGNPLNNLGELYRTMGRLQDAVYAFEEVIQLREKLLGTNHPNYANAVNNLALVHFALGHYEEAEKYLLACRDIYKRTLGDKHRFYANSLNNLASVYKEQGRLKEAMDNYRECLRVFKETYGEASDKYGVYLGGLAGTYRMMKNYKEAIALTIQSMNIIKNKLGEHHYDVIETEYNLAEMYRESGNPEAAEKHYLHAIEGFLFLISKYFPFLGEKEKTAFYYNVVHVFETFNSFVIQRYTEAPAKDHAVLVARMYDNQVALKSLLLRESEKMKTRVAAGSNTTLKQDYARLVKMREAIAQQYRLSTDELAEQGVDMKATEAAANELEQQIAIALNIGSSNNTAQKTIGWKDIQAGLKPGECAVEMIRTDFYTNGRWTDTICYTALVVDKTGGMPRLMLMNNGKELETKSLARYRTAIKSRVNDDQSYDLFWKPLQKVIGAAKKIYFCPDGIYQQVNLYTLKNPLTQKYLVEEADITLVTNTQDILQPSRPAAAKKAELFSFPDYGSLPDADNAFESRRPGFPNLPELPGTKIEADSVKNILGAKNWIVSEHLRKEANEEAIKRIAGPGVLHIATHGFFLKAIDEKTKEVFGLRSEVARDNPLLRSGLILAGAAAIARDSVTDNSKDDGILTAYEASGLDLTNTELVVLSACETGLGEVRNGQGVYGLQRAFLVAGSRSVIMSLWVIDDYATQELMSNFYREWLKDPSGNKQAAFRKAQLNMKEKFASPYFWGAFIIVGD